MPTSRKPTRRAPRTSGAGAATSRNVAKGDQESVRAILDEARILPPGLQANRILDALDVLYPSDKTGDNTPAEDATTDKTEGGGQ